MSNLRKITPDRAAELVENGAMLVDIREADEHRRERITGAQHWPLSGLRGSSRRPATDTVVIFHCRSGSRTEANASLLEGCAGDTAYILDGGLTAWKRAGLPVTTDRSQPIDIMRQVQIAAGGLVLLGVALGSAEHPAFYLLSALVGAGLVFAGVTGFCGMARLLSYLPWNRRAAAS